MSSRNIAVILLELLIVGAVILVLAFMIKGARDKEKDDQNLIDTLSMVTTIKDNNITLFVVGDAPLGLATLEDNLVIVDPAEVNDETMPTYTQRSTFTSYDNDGNVVSSSPSRTYSGRMMILVNSFMLSTDSVDVIRRCAVDNNVPVIVIGGTSINMFSISLMLPDSSNLSNDSILYSLSSGLVNSPITSEEIRSGGRIFSNAVLRTICEYYSLGPKEPTPKSSEVSFQTAYTNPNLAQETTWPETAGIIDEGEIPTDNEESEFDETDYSLEHFESIIGETTS